jgi:chemotaxis response regulator CheB
MNDGAGGLTAVRQARGLALVQDPAEARFPGMPRAAIAAADPQFVAPLSGLADHLGAWISGHGIGSHPHSAGD